MSINTTILNYGGFELNVHPIDNLIKLKKEDYNKLAIGPQEEFLKSLHDVNYALSHYGVPNIGTYDNWNWKKGDYDKMRNFVFNKLHLNKKPKNMACLVDRAIDSTNYLNYTARQIRTMERQRTQLRNLGVSKNIDINEFMVKCNDFIANINKGCDTLYDYSNGKVEIKPYFQFEDMDSKLFLDITMRDLSLSVAEGDSNKVIQEIPINVIRIIISSNFRQYLNNKIVNWHIVGRYYEELNQNTPLRFPYISQRFSRNYDGYDAVCLDRFTDDIKNGFKKHKILDMGFALMNWAQIYNTRHSNPYNKPSFMHIGLPEGYSEEYKATLNINDVSNTCSGNLNVRMYNNEWKPYYYNYDIEKMKYCTSINCQLKDDCYFHNKAMSTLCQMSLLDFADDYYMIESYVGNIIEYLQSIEADETERGEFISRTTLTNLLERITGTFIAYDDNYWTNQASSLYHYLTIIPVPDNKDWNLNLVVEFASTLRKLILAISHYQIDARHLNDMLFEGTKSDNDDLSDEQKEILKKTIAFAMGRS